MTTDGLAAAANKLLSGKRRRKLEVSASVWEWIWFHLGLWGVGKTGKSHIGLDARTSEVRKPDIMDDFNRTDKGEVLIPSKPIPVAYANFDRDAASVLQNLPEDVDIITEDFFLDDLGELLVSVLMNSADFDKLFNLYAEFIKDSVSDGIELIHVDGGTILWEDMRMWKLPAPVDPGTGEAPGYQPKQYATPNIGMRTNGKPFVGAKSKID